MLFNLGDKEILIVIAVFLFVTVGVSGLIAFSLGGLKRWWRGRGKEER